MTEDDKGAPSPAGANSTDQSNPAPVSAIGEPDATEREFIRQSERTIDNLKRLSAVVFAISFAVVGSGAVAKLRPVLTDPAAPLPSMYQWIVNIEMLLAFTVTAGLFYYQGDKFLDNHFARHPIPHPDYRLVAGRYIMIVATMVPFYLMAQSLAPEVTSAVGFTWFFGSYVLLLGIGLLLLLMPFVFRLKPRYPQKFEPKSAPEDSVVRAFWFMMNSVMLSLMVVAFWAGHRLGDACPTTLRPGDTPYFLFAFGLLALLRDVIDYRWAFRFHYPVRGEPSSQDMWPVTALVRTGRLWPCYAVGVAALAAMFTAAWDLQLADVRGWVNTCTIR